MKIARWVSYIAVAAALGLATQYTAYAETAAEIAQPPVKINHKTSHKNENKGDKVAAVVNDKKITVADVEKLKSALPPQLRSQIKDESKLFALIRDQLVDLTLIIEYAKTSGLVGTSEFVAAREKAIEQLMVQGTLADVLKKNVTEAAVKKRYQEELAKIPKDAMEVNVKHILIKNKKTAQEIVEKLNSGGDFGKLARDFSEDKATSVNDGDVGYFQKDEMLPEFSKAAFDLKVNEYTKEPVETKHGFHIIKLLDRRKFKPKSLEDMSERIQPELAEEAVRNFLMNLAKKAKVVRYDQDGKVDKALIDNTAALSDSTTESAQSGNDKSDDKS